MFPENETEKTMKNEKMSKLGKVVQLKNPLISSKKNLAKNIFLFWADLKQHDNQYNDTPHNASQCNDVQHKDTLGNTKQ